MNAGHTCPTRLAAAGIQCTPVLAINELTQETMEFAFEYRLKAAKHKITSGGRVDEKGEVVRNQQFGERGAFDAGVNGGNADEAVTVGVDQRGYELSDLAAGVGCHGLQHSDPCIDVVGLRCDGNTLGCQPAYDTAREPRLTRRRTRSVAPRIRAGGLARPPYRLVGIA
jgi:hypothetical protein